MKIHLGGSVSDLKKHPERFKIICQSIKRLGHQLTRDWVSDELNGKTITHEKMFENTVKAINQAEIVILETTDSNSAVGQQIMLAAEKGIPILKLRYGKPQKKKTSFGQFLPRSMAALTDEKFYEEKSVKEIISSFIKTVGNKYGYSRFNLVLEKRFDNYLKSKAKKNQTSKTEEIKKLIQNDMTKRKSK